MIVENFPLEELIRLAAARGGFHLRAALRPPEDLIRIAAAAGASGARLTISELGIRPMNDLVRIAAAGQGSVAFVGD